MRERDDINLELAGETVVVAVFGMGETAADNAARLVEALEHAVEQLPVGATPSARGSRRRRRGGRSR